MYTSSYPLIDTCLTHKSTEERGFGANKYGGKKNKDYRAITKAKNLNYQSRLRSLPHPGRSHERMPGTLPSSWPGPGMWCTAGATLLQQRWQRRRQRRQQWPWRLEHFFLYMGFFSSFVN